MGNQLNLGESDRQWATETRKNIEVRLDFKRDLRAGYASALILALDRHQGIDIHRSPKFELPFILAAIPLSPLRTQQ